MTSIVGVDVGNSRVKATRLAPDRLSESAAYPAADLVLDLRDASALAPELVGLGGPPPLRFHLVASDPVLATALAATLEGAGHEVRIWTARDLPMSHPYPEPDRLGPDRLLAAWSARELLGGGPAVVIDAGTAITVDLVDGAGGFAGGAIAPGVAALARALGAAGRMLVEVEIAPPIHYPGRCREEALAAGIAETIAGGVQRLVGRALACEPGAPLIITGGDAGRIAGLVPELDLRHEPGLIARGLALLECRG